MRLYPSMCPTCIDPHPVDSPVAAAVERGVGGGKRLHGQIRASVGGKMTKVSYVTEPKGAFSGEIGPAPRALRRAGPL